MKTDVITVRVNHDIKVKFTDVCEDTSPSLRMAVAKVTCGDKS
jgi:antitoxin component of RelBE/YafQ-DinJ toxin-antitoxin module